MFAHERGSESDTGFNKLFDIIVGRMSFHNLPSLQPSLILSDHSSENISRKA